MNSLIFAFLCLGAVVSANYISNDEGQWKGEGLAESQDNGQYDQGYGGYNGASNYAGAYSGAYAHGAAPIGHHGRVVDTPEVAHAKAAHFAAVAASNGAGHGAYNGAYNNAYNGEDGQWKGEGLAESQDNGHYNNGYNGASAYAGAYSGAYAHGAAPLGHDGRVVDTPEVAHAKAAHFAAISQATSGVAHVYSVPAYGAHAVPAAHAGYAHVAPSVYGAAPAHAGYAHVAAHGSYAHY